MPRPASEPDTIGPTTSRRAAPHLGRGLAALALVWIPALATTVAAADRDRPNVIVILTDDQGYGDLGCHGNPTLKTPHLDRLHGESIRFTDFHVAPVCSPTRGQLLTGRDAYANGARLTRRGLDMIWPHVPTMADIFRKSGYRTGLFGKWHLGSSYPHRPNDRGFDEAIHHQGGMTGIIADYWNNDSFDDHYMHNGAVRQFRGYCQDVWFGEAIDWMKRSHAAGDPFFLYIATNCPHVPLFVPDSYREPYSHLGPYLSSFYGMIANLDENLGRLEQALDDAGLRENTIVIFTTDNGGTIGTTHFNAGMRSKKGSPYEGGHRVPCFIRWPAGGFTPPRDVPDCTQCQDILPTLVTLCGLDAAGAVFDGTDLTGLLRGTQQALPDRKLVVMNGVAILWNKWRLVNRRELYDLRTDPGQTQDVAAAHADVVRSMQAHYAAWREKLGPDVDRTVGFTVGAPQQACVCLTAMDLPESKLVLTQALARQGRMEKGAWHVNVATEGTYRIALRRWPREAGGTLRSGMPAHEPVDKTFLPTITPRDDYALQGCEFPAGSPLPIRTVRLRLDGYDETVTVTDDDAEAVFEVPLSVGRVGVSGLFYDEQGKELGGVNYAYVEKVPQ